MSNSVESTCDTTTDTTSPSQTVPKLQPEPHVVVSPPSSSHSRLDNSSSIAISGGGGGCGGGGDDDGATQPSEECSSVGTHSMPDATQSSSALFTPSPSTILQQVGTPQPPALTSIASWEMNKESFHKSTISDCGKKKQKIESSSQNFDEEHVTINLSSGEDLFAKPYENSVSGHHVMLQQEGLIWKATRSLREERFYVTMRFCTMDSCHRPKIVTRHQDIVGLRRHDHEMEAECRNHDDGDVPLEEEEDKAARRTIYVNEILGESVPDQELIQSAASLEPFVPKFFGMRQVRKLRCVHDQHTPGSVTGSSDFPSTPRDEQRFDAAARHTAEEIVASFQSQMVSVASTTASPPGLDRSAVGSEDTSSRLPVFSQQATTRVTGGDESHEQAISRSAPSDCVLSPEKRKTNDDTRSPSSAVLEANACDDNKQDDDGPTESDPFSAFADTLEGGHDERCALASSAPASTNPALRRNTLLPAKAPENGRPLDHNLPRTADQLVDMIVLEDVCHGFVRPCVLDIKMGSRQYGVNAPEGKRQSKTEKARKSSSSTLGLRVSGYKRWNAKSRTYEAKGKRECFSYNTSQIEDTLHHFFGGDPQLIAHFIRIVQEFEGAFRKQTAFRFFTSSVLLVFDGERPCETARLAMVDFAYTYCRSELVSANDEHAHENNDSGYLRGIESLGCMLGHVLNRCLHQP